MKRIITLFLVFIMLFSISAFAEPLKDRLEIYVDIKAEASGDGNINSPFKTVEEAQAKVREIVASGNYPAGGIVVFIRGGVYTISDTIYFDERDSGKENAPVVWRAYYNEEVTITPSTTIPFSKFDYTDDERIPKDAQGKVLSYNLKENGIAGYDGLFLGGHQQHYYWIVGKAEPGSPQWGLPAPEVFFGNEEGRLAEYPNDMEWMGVKEVIDLGTNGWANDTGWGSKYQDEKSRAELDLTNGMTLKVSGVNEKRMKRWEQAKNPWFDSYWRWDYSDLRGPMGEINADELTIKTGCAVNNRCDPKIARWRIYNLIEELDAPGEWFYDEDNGELYVFPPAGIRATDNLTLSFQRKDIFNLKNAHDIVIRDFNLTGTRSSGVYGESCNRIEVAFCDITKCSYMGVALYDSDDCYIHGNTLKLIGSKGISVTGGDRETLRPSNTLIENNSITKYARIQKAYMGGIDIQGIGVKIRNNSISDAPQLAISYGGNDHLFERNDIFDVVKETSDMGAIYRYWTRNEMGNVFLNNAIHDLETDSADSIGVFGLYWDGGATHETAIGNVFYNIKGTAISFIGPYNTVKNNIFANVTGAGIRFGAVSNNFSGLNNGHIDGVEDYVNNPAYAKYKDFKDLYTGESLMNGDWKTTKNVVIKDNIRINTPKLASITFGGSSMTNEMMRSLNEYDEGINYTEDPGFLSMENNNYTLLETSKVFKQLPSFKEANIDMAKIGTITGMWQHYLGENSLVFKKDSVLSYVDFEEALLEKGIKTVDNVAYIPLRYSYEGMDFPVEWDGDKKEVNIKTKLLELSFKLDSAEYIKNGENKTLKSKILFDNGVTYISAEDFAEITEISLYTTDDGIYIFSEKDLSGVIYDDMLKDLNDRLKM